MSAKMDMIEIETKKLELETGKFELDQRQAKALSVSAFFPDNLKNDVASAVIVYDLAKRMDISVMEVSQSIFIIYGRPSFSTTFLVARLNQSGRIQGALKTIVADDLQSAYCMGIDAFTGDELIGMTVTMDMARKEGWVGKKGSKWVNMPELMMRKRSQSFFIKEYFPEVMFGLQSSEEVNDIEAIETEIITSKNDINQALMAGHTPKAKVAVDVTPTVGKSEEEVARNEAIGEAQANAVPTKPKATRVPRYISEKYFTLEQFGVKKHDMRKFVDYMDWMNQSKEELAGFFGQGTTEVKRYVNAFYGIEEVEPDATDAVIEEDDGEAERIFGDGVESPNVPTATASQEHTGTQTQETSTQEPKAGVSLARHKGVLIGKGIKPQDTDEFFAWAGVDSSNIADFFADAGAVDALVEQFNEEAGYAEN